MRTQIRTMLTAAVVGLAVLAGTAQSHAQVVVTSPGFGMGVAAGPLGVGAVPAYGYPVGTGVVTTSYLAPAYAPVAGAPYANVYGPTVYTSTTYAPRVYTPTVYTPTVYSPTVIYRPGGYYYGPRYYRFGRW